MKYHGEDVELTMAYPAMDGDTGIVSAGPLTYRPLTFSFSTLGMSDEEWDAAWPQLLRVIQEVDPDIIQCFGAEWPYGAIAEHTDVPVIIHMMGFLNAYNPALSLVTGAGSSPTSRVGALRKLARMVRSTLFPRRKTSEREQSMAFERRTMRANRFFLGRTEWDKKIVEHYSPGSRYFHVAELMRAPIMEAAGSWAPRRSGKLRLLTISSADDRKGNEIILMTAKLLKELLGIDFEWRVAGRTEFFPAFERHSKINRDSVNVELIGMIDPRRVARELAEADFFIHPSIIDNSPNSLCEAQVVGCPVIASNVGGIPQLVEDGVTGFLYPYNEPHALAFLIDELHRDVDRLERISKNEVEASLARHDPRLVANALMATYEAVIKERNTAQ